MLLDLPRDVIRSVTHFRLHVHTLRVETSTWNFTPLPTCNLCVADDNVQDKKLFSFTARTLRWFHSAGSTHVLNFTDRTGCVCFLTPGKQQTPFFIHQLIYLMNRRAVIFLDWKPFFLVILLTSLNRVKKLGHTRKSRNCAKQSTNLLNKFTVINRDVRARTQKHKVWDGNIAFLLNSLCT
jgi:hypothetical protein